MAAVAGMATHLGQLGVELSIGAQEGLWRYTSYRHALAIQH